MTTIIAKNISWFGDPALLFCDARCDKAWGISNRPLNRLGEDIDDFEFLSDTETPTAPANPGTFEGECGKPKSPEFRLNKWCARECERSCILEAGETGSLKDFSKRRPNFQSRHDAKERAGGDET